MPFTDTHIRSLKPDMRPRKCFGGGLFLFLPPPRGKQALLLISRMMNCKQEPLSGKLVMAEGYGYICVSNVDQDEDK